MDWMRPPLPADRAVSEILQMSRESNGYRELVYRFGDYLKATLGLEDALVKENSPGTAFTPADELTLNTGKPYIDNGLSEYSASELITYYNRGFRSCIIVPMAKDGRQFGTVTLLSNSENGFLPAHISMLTVASSVVSSELGAKYEREKSLNIAKYFDASFNNMLPQFLIDSNGGIVKANKSAMNYFNRTQKELMDAKLSEVFAIDGAKVERLKKGEVIESPGIAYQDRKFEISPSRINENLIHLMVADVSDTEDAEEKAAFLDMTGDEMFVTLDDNFSVTWASSGSNSLFGIDSGMLEGKKFTDFITYPVKVQDSLSSIKGNGYSGQVKLNFGNDVEFSAKLVACRGEMGFHCIISRDYEKYVNSMEKLANGLVELSNDPIIEIDSAGYILSFNKAAEGLFEFDKGVVGTPVYSLYADNESQNKIVASLAIAKNNGSISDVFVNVMKHNSRAELPCVQTIKSVEDSTGKTAKFVIMNRELATKKRIEELNENLERELKEVEKLKTESDLKSQFIYNISHDLKTPITNIMGFSKILLTDNSETLTKEQRDYIQIIYDESERFLQLVKQILDVAKLSSGIVKLDLQDVDFNQIKENASIKSLAEACANRGLEFSWSVDYDVPVIQADPNRIIQVFSNLIGNAIKFTEKGGISVKVMRKKGSVRIEVADTGIGISKEDKPKIFKKFYQLRRGLVVQKASGTGLGLSIAKEIVNLHNGRINVDSEIGKGSTFWFTLPMHPKIRSRTLKYNKAEHS